MLQNFEYAYNQAIDCKMEDRISEIEHSLKIKPIKIEICDFKNFKHKIVLYNTGFQAIYQGTGVAVLYIKYNKMIAFHYGFDKPNNIPRDCQEVRGCVRNHTIFMKHYTQDVQLDRKNMIKDILNKL